MATSPITRQLLATPLPRIHGDRVCARQGGSRWSGSRHTSRRNGAPRKSAKVPQRVRRLRPKRSRRRMRARKSTITPSATSQPGGPRLRPSSAASTTHSGRGHSTRLLTSIASGHRCTFRSALTSHSATRQGRREGIKRCICVSRATGPVYRRYRAKEAHEHGDRHRQGNGRPAG